MSTTKTCTVCRRVKVLEEFHRQPSGPLGRHSWCRDCLNAEQRKRSRTKPAEMRRRHNLQTRYAMTIADVEAMLKAQNFACAICLKPLTMETKKVDHHHGTGRVRGLLCQRCNMFCAAFDDTTFVERARAYLALPVDA